MKCSPKDILALKRSLKACGFVFYEDNAAINSTRKVTYNNEWGPNLIQREQEVVITGVRLEIVEDTYDTYFYVVYEKQIRNESFYKESSLIESKYIPVNGIYDYLKSIGLDVSNFIPKQ